MAISKEQQQITHGYQTFTAAEGARSGASAGAVLGVILGGVILTHTPDALHVGIALGIVLFCVLAGMFFGILVSKINPA